MTSPLSRLSVAVLAFFCTVSLAHAHGEIGDHVNDLKGHIDEYTKEVRWFLNETEALIQRYEADGAKAVNAQQLVDNWEEVKFHAAIETTYVPVYAAIWQGIFGVHDVIKQGKPVAEAKKQQVALEEAMWQALGAVKLAAKNQAEGPAVASESLATDPVATLSEIKEALDRVVAKYAERDLETATDLVHSTYANRFEGVEGPLIEHDAALVEDLEKDFNVILPQRIQGGSAPVADVEAVVADMKRKLEQAQALLKKAEENRRSVF